MKLVAIDFECATVELECATCGGTGELRMSRHDMDPDWCPSCSGNRVAAFYFGIFLANLAVAGALTESWILGAKAGAQWADNIDTSGDAWAPNARGDAAACIHLSTSMFVDGKAECFDCGEELGE